MEIEKSSTHRHMTVKLKAKRRQNLESSEKKKWLTYRGAAVRVMADFASGTMDTIRQWHAIFQVMKGKCCQPKLLYPAKLSLKN